MGLNSVLIHQQKRDEGFLFDLKRIENVIKQSSQSKDTGTNQGDSPRKGGIESFSFSRNGSSHVDQYSSRRCYRIVGYKTDHDGNKSVIDILDGSEYYCGHRMDHRISKDVVVYDSKDSALSERFPCHQVGSSRSGNGRYPRALVSFDCWGHNRRRLGGGQSTLYEYAKFIAIVQTLDAPFPISKQRSKTSVPPNFFGPVDFSHPHRDRFDKDIKKDRKF